MTSELAAVHAGRDRGIVGEWVCVRGLIPTAETWQTEGLNINKSHMALLFLCVPGWRQQQLSPPRQTRLWPDMLQGVYILMPLLVFQNMLPSHSGRDPRRSTKPGDVSF